MKLNSRRVREIALVVLVALAAALANLPEETLERFDIDRGLLLGSLALLVFIELFLYLKFQFFFLVVLLAVAANMPGEVAESLGISTLPLVIAMATMVGFSLINYVVDLLPTGLEKKPREQSAEGIRVLFYAIEKGNLIYAQKVLSQNFNPHALPKTRYRTQPGRIPYVQEEIRPDAGRMRRRGAGIRGRQARPDFQLPGPDHLRSNLHQHASRFQRPGRAKRARRRQHQHHHRARAHPDATAPNPRRAGRPDAGVFPPLPDSHASGRRDSQRGRLGFHRERRRLYPDQRARCR